MPLSAKEMSAIKNCSGSKEEIKGDYPLFAHVPYVYCQKLPSAPLVQCVSFSGYHAKDERSVFHSTTTTTK